MNGLVISPKAKPVKLRTDPITASILSTSKRLQGFSSSKASQNKDSQSFRIPPNNSVLGSEKGTPKTGQTRILRNNTRFPMIPSEKTSLNNTLNSSSNNSTLKLNNSIQRANQSQTSDLRVAWQSPRVGGKLSKEASLTSIADPLALFESMQLPLSPSSALKHFSGYLSGYEQSEILDYQQIYWLGLKAKKLRTDVHAPNYGFDDDRSDYKLVPGDHIAYRYEIIQMLGKGSFGQVCKCLDHKRNEYVAVKVIRNQRRFHRQGKVEIKVLKHIVENDKNDAGNMIHMTNYFLFRNHLVTYT